MACLQNYENNSNFQLFTEFIQAQKSYPTSLDKIDILNSRGLVIGIQFVLVN